MERLSSGQAAETLEGPGGEDPDELPPGTRFGRYEVRRLLGRGAFGAVYDALQTEPLQRPVALKVLHEVARANQQLVGRFVREAQIAASITHPHICTVFDIGSEGGVPYIAMERLHGEALDARLDRERVLSAEVTADLLLPVLSAVAAVHDAGIVHRDLKPANLFLATPRPGALVPKLLDFGIVKVLDRDAHAARTETRSFLGTPHYTSPEQAMDASAIDVRSDQWSLGVILFECLCGARPFRGESLLALLSAIAAQPTPDPRTLAPAVPPELAAAVMRSLAKRPGDRWPSVRAFGAALLPFASAPVHAQWTVFFQGDGALDATHAGEAPGPRSLSGLPSVVPHPGTLKPTTRSLVEAGVRPSNLPRVFVFGAVGVGVLALGGTLAATLMTPPPTAPLAPVRASAAPVAAVVPTPVARPAGTRSAHALAPAEAAPEAPATAPAVDPVPVVVVPDTPAPTGVAPVAVTLVDDPTASTHRHRRGRHGAPRLPPVAPGTTPSTPTAPPPSHSSPARTDCANGICPVD